MTAKTASREDLAARVGDLEARLAEVEAERDALQERIDFLTSPWWDTCEVSTGPTFSEETTS